MSQFIKQEVTKKKTENTISTKNVTINSHNIKVLHVPHPENFKFKWAYITNTVNLTKENISIMKDKSGKNIKFAPLDEKEYFYNYFSVPLEKTSIEDHINSLISSKNNENKMSLFIRLCKIVYRKKIFICDCKEKKCNKAAFIFELCLKTIERIISKYIQEEKCKSCENQNCLELCKTCFMIICSNNCFKCSDPKCGKIICLKDKHSKDSIKNFIKKCELCNNVFCFKCLEKHNINNTLSSMSCVNGIKEQTPSQIKEFEEEMISSFINDGPEMIFSDNE